MSRVIVGVVCALLGGALLGNGFFQGVYSIVQWVEQRASSGLDPSPAGLLAGLGLGLLLVGLGVLREGLRSPGARR